MKVKILVFLLKNIKNITISVLLLCLIFMIFNKCNSDKEYNNLKDLHLFKTKELVKTRDSLGRETTKTNALYLDRKAIEQSILNDNKTLQEENIKLKNLASYTNVKIEYKDNIKTILKDSLIYVKDTITNDCTKIVYKNFDYKDEFLNLNGYTKNDSLKLNYSLKSDVEIIYYWKRKHFLARKKLYVIVKHNNPKAETKELLPIIVEPRKFFLWRWLGL